MSKRWWTALGRLWDSVLPALICLNPMAMGYYLAIAMEEMPLNGSVQVAGMAMIERVKATPPLHAT